MRTRIVLANLTGEYVKLQQIYQTGRYAGTYAAAADRAEQMIGLIGVRNAYEGYFTAKVELLGVGPPIDKI